VDDLESYRREFFLVDDGDQRAREHVVAGARPAVHHEFYRPRRPELREGGGGRAGGDKAGRTGKKFASQHGVPPNWATVIIARSPCDIMSDWRSARSMLSPSTKPRINGAVGYFSLPMI